MIGISTKDETTSPLPRDVTRTTVDTTRPDKQKNRPDETKIELRNRPSIATRIDANSPPESTLQAQNGPKESTGDDGKRQDELIQDMFQFMKQHD